MKVCVGFCEWSLESMRIYGMEFHFHTHTRKPMITMNHTELKYLGIRYIFLGPKKVKPSNCSTHFEASEEKECCEESRSLCMDDIDTTKLYMQSRLDRHAVEKNCDRCN